MRAVEGSLGHSPRATGEICDALARAHGTSRRASGRAGEKVARNRGSTRLPYPFLSSLQREWVYLFISFNQTN
jgi:hypothetical protein